jgi:integrase
VATLIKRPGSYAIKFYWNGEQIKRTLGTDSEREALGLQLQIERTLADIRRGRLVVPAGADPWQFILSDGRLAAPQAPSFGSAPTLAKLLHEYFATPTTGAKESNTLATERLHRRHLERLMDARLPVPAIVPANVQSYINARAAERRKGKPISAATVKKEVATLRMILNRSELLVGAKAPEGLFKKLVYPKAKEKPPFLTWGEIAAKLARMKDPSKAEAKALWDSLFLDPGQVEEFLDWCQARPTRQPVPFLVPLVTAAGHTGARVSELIRSRVEDWDLDGGSVVLREKKKSQKAETFRRVDLSARLTRVMHAWLSGPHPGGRLAFCRERDVPLNTQNLRTVFRKFLKAGPWQVVRGYHTLRHSFASNLAAAGIDPAVVDELMGHQTEEMRKRYRHLYPQHKKAAIQVLFDGQKRGVAERRKIG